MSENLSMPRSFTRGNREIPAVPKLGNQRGTGGEGSRLKTAMYAAGKSDEGVVPANSRRQPPKAGREGLKPRGLRRNERLRDTVPGNSHEQIEASVRSTPLPEVGAVCGNSARTDLSGGRPERAVPTAPAVYTPLTTGPDFSLARSSPTRQAE